MTNLTEHLKRLPELQSEPRRHSLFADLGRTRRVNAEAYAINVQFWKRLIQRTLDQGWLVVESSREEQDAPHTTRVHTPSVVTDQSRLMFTLNHLRHLYTWQGEAPLGLGAVIRDMESSGEIMSLGDFYSTPAARWSAWLFEKLVSGPLVWGLQQLNLVEEDSEGVGLSNSSWNSGVSGDGQGSLRVEQTPLVSIPTLKAAATKVVNRQKHMCQYPVTDNLMSIDMFRERFYVCLPGTARGKSEIQYAMAESDAQVLLTYLERDIHQVLVRRDPNTLEITWIKFLVSHPSSSNTPRRSPPQFTETDHNIVQMMVTQDQLCKQISGIEHRVVELTTLAKQALSNQRRHQALSYLRLRKELSDTNLRHRMQAYETLAQIITKIQTATTDADILAAYALGSQTLRDIMAQSELSPDKMDTTFDQVRETLEDYQEVEQAFQAGMEDVLATTEEVGEEEEVDVRLERELEALIRQEKSEISVAKEVRKTPSTKIPVKSITKNSPESSTQSMKEVPRSDSQEDKTFILLDTLENTPDELPKGEEGKQEKITVSNSATKDPLPA
ncbi:Charged multivesicular body protein 7 [Dispira simplex]|nr:Charged multivesicular body protein 7 [Dispira simplex]